jgi:hypothetical protein
MVNQGIGHLRYKLIHRSISSVGHCASLKSVFLPAESSDYNTLWHHRRSIALNPASGCRKMHSKAVFFGAVNSGNRRVCVGPTFDVLYGLD